MYADMICVCVCWKCVSFGPKHEFASYTQMFHTRYTQYTPWWHWHLCVCLQTPTFRKNYFIRIRKKKKTLPHYIMNMKQMESAARLSVCMSGLVVCIPYAQPSPSLQLPRQDNITTRSESVFCCSFWSTTTKNGCVHTIFAHLSICYNTKFVEEGIGIVHGKTFWGGATIFCRPNLMVCRTDFSCFSAVAVQLCVPCALPAL